ncbi:MAG TPA: hypothetical protein VEP90_22195 [Methylomirabilota bacterium]|nr:hypothetical protein [Methylomirabilota bacterium]
MPAFKRYALSEITFAQRKLMCDELAGKGIKADCVVIADDENLDIAKMYGFHIVERDNEFLGRRFNDGHELAGKLGFDYSTPVGSDMFVDHELFVGLDDQFTITNYYAIVRKDGGNIATMFVDWGILQIIPTRMMKSMDYRPCAEDLKRGCDTSARNRIKNRTENKILIPARKEAHAYECISFQSKQQITSYQGLVNTYKAHTFEGEATEVIAPLRKWYPELLLDKMVEYYLSGTSEKL